MRRHLALSAATLAAAVTAFGGTAAVASAAGTATTTTPTTTSPTTTAPPTSTAPTPPKPKPKPPAKASITVSLPTVFVVSGKTVTVPGRLLQATGVVRPYVPGQWVLVKTFLGHKQIKRAKLRLKPTSGRRSGAFTESLRSPGAGILRIEVTHERTPQQVGFSSRRAVAVLDEHVGFGSRSPLVSLIQHRLSALHVYVPQSGVYDQHTGLAIDAYHRLLGDGFSQQADPRMINALLNGQGAFHVRFPNDGKHVEGNLHTQLLALIYGSKVYRIYPISSGKPSTPTILGHFRVYERTPGYLPDGMYYSDFFIRGYAIHGYNPAPDYPASHGCMRLPITDAISVYDWLAIGDVVDTYL
jgi:L,D-transpeptidase catalytic domain